MAKELPEAPSRPLSAPSGLHAALRIVRGIAGVIDHDRQLYSANPHDESLVTAWRAHGCLPRGISAACLALAVVHAPRWPLIIDPVGVGCRWIRSAERLMKSRFFEVSPATALDARTALQDSISQGCSVLLHVDKIPACCSDRSVFEDCLVWHKRHFTGLPKNTPGLRFYFAASASYPVLTDVAVATFSVVVFYMDDVGLRSSLGVSVAARMSSMDLIASFNSVHHAATSLLIAEGVLLEQHCPWCIHMPTPIL